MKKILNQLTWKQPFVWLPLFGFIVAVVWMLATPQRSQAQFWQDARIQIESPAVAIAGETYFSGDKTVGENEVIDGDLVLWSGDVTLEDGGEVKGSVVAYSGEVFIGENSVVHGDVTVWSGDVSIDGFVHGSVAAWSGNVSLNDYAAVDGDVSVMSGEIDRSEDAVVKGSIVSGPNFKWPGLGNPFERWGMKVAQAPIPPLAPDAPRVPDIRVVVNDNQPGPIGRFFGFVFSVIGGLFVSALAGVVAAMVYSFRPELVRQIRTNVTEQPVYAAVAGAVVNLPLAAIAGLLFITFCLIPLALPPLLLLIGLNVVGLTGMAQIVGERISKQLNLQLEASFVIGVGAFAIVGVISILWAFGSCFGGIAWLAAIVVGSMGTGALLMPWLKRFGNSNSTASGTGTAFGTSVATYAPSGTGVKVDIGTDGMKHEMNSPAQPATPATPAVPVMPSAPAASVVPPVVVNIEPVKIDVGNPTPASAANVGAVTMNLGDTLVDLNAKPEASTAPLTPPVSVPGSEEIEIISLEPESTPAPLLDVSDFTIIKGIGVVLDRRLKVAGIITFAQLAALTPEQVAEIFDRPLTWVMEDDIIGQAKYFASR